ncbi:MAG TPA: response regulator transcription factor [Rubrobacteraceae bacterium]|nr:response regulator transcription factor [Rubrobacteraceae bacterium]
MALACRMKADVVIMQVQMPFERAKEALDQMRAVEPTPKVIIVTMFEDPAFIRNLLKLGASGYVLKSGSSQQLVGTVRAAVFAPKEGNVVVGMPREMLEEAEGGSDGVLSARELEILLLAAQGLSNRQTATRIHLAEGTFKSATCTTVDADYTGRFTNIVVRNIGHGMAKNITFEFSAPCRAWADGIDG